MRTLRSQRWRERRARFIPNATTINPADYAVDVIEERDAKPFVIQHHYSGSYPAGRLCAGLFRGRELVGVAAFSVPMNNRVVPKHTGLVDHSHGAELGRFVLLDDVPGNGETWFLRRAFSALRREKPDIVSVVSFADPVERIGPDGTVVKPGHVGMIYQALGANYRGRGTPRTERVTPDGQPFCERAISKIRKLEQGHAYAVDELVRRGASRPAQGADLRAWLMDLRASGFLSSRRHPGNHVYAFALTKAAKSAGRSKPCLPYPLRVAA